MDSVSLRVLGLNDEGCRVAGTRCLAWQKFQVGQRSGKACRQLMVQLLSASTCCVLCWRVHRHFATDPGLQECHNLGEPTMQSQ